MSNTKTTQQTHVLLHEHSNRCERCGSLVKGWDTASPPPSICYGGPPSGDDAARLYLEVKALEQQLSSVADQIGVDGTDGSGTLAEAITQRIQLLTDDNDDRAYYTGMANGFKDAGNLVMSKAYERFADNDDAVAAMLRKMAQGIIQKGAEAHHQATQFDT